VPFKEDSIMMFENIMFAAICWLCSLIFGAIALWAFKRTDPMHFWSGSTVRPEEIRDIPSYNRANGLMWVIYAACMVVTGILSLFSIMAGTVLLVIICVPGSFVLVIAYNRIYNKYKSEIDVCNSCASAPKTPKVVITSKAVISAIVIIAIGVMFYYGEKDPEVRVLDDRIQIKAMYGVDIDFSEIADIFLLEKSMRDIGIGRRTNGYGGIGETLKGNFKADALGETLLFVQSGSTPTIKIERTGKKAVYISYRSSERTLELYRRLQAEIPLE
jgi:hypothetical protein